MEQLPGLTSVRVASTTVQISGVFEVKLTERPELAVAVREADGDVIVRPDGGVNVIDCEPALTSNV